MAPTISAGDYVVAFTRFIRPAPRLKSGRIYLINHSDLGLIIKRFERETVQGRLIFSGDNRASNSGHILGEIEKARVIARAFLKIHKRGVSIL